MNVSAQKQSPVFILILMGWASILAQITKYQYSIVDPHLNRFLFWIFFHHPTKSLPEEANAWNSWKYPYTLIGCCHDQLMEIKTKTDEVLVE